MRTWSDYLKTAQTEDPIFASVREGHYSEVLKYLENLGNPNLRNHKGHSLLMLAAYNGQLPLVSLLISCHADVNSRDDSGNTILMGVAFKGHKQIVQQLLRAGADPLAVNPKGQTALTFAEAFGRHEVAALLADLDTGYRTVRPRFFRRISAMMKLFSLPTKGA
ncbi:ankyrin repeat domain-containing protein [Bdellovibrio bacteriovorus]|uniref:ankyrin repeat domain-containing protein n=1 Tax=Bdellovibrio bacteriovorus TaxID=959 RepID=UPI0021D0838A|nr:ankyrin repeat domain-containing protein [Bdellovibrio bacteriovorus]UXR64703.1 ankyrin repeat domain-containing protein [Bdellovibrio bacteriovorus]